MPQLDLIGYVRRANAPAPKLLSQPYQVRQGQQHLWCTCWNVVSQVSPL